MPAADFSFLILDSVDSTNNYAMAKVHAGLAKHGDAFFAFEQSAGKGQRGNSWQTGNGENIALSIIVQPGQLKQGFQFCLSATVALACADLFKQYAGEETQIKWPNDIYWRDRKAGGILIETVLRGKEWKWAITGIGMNINQVKFATDLRNPVSLKQITGKSFDVVEIAKELHLLLMKRIGELNISSPADIVVAYNQQLYRVNEKVTFTQQGHVFEGIVKGVNLKGQLEVFTDEERLFDFGEIEWVL